MKKLLLSFIFMLAALTVGAVDLAPVSNAFKTGNADILKDKMDKEVDMAIPGAIKKCTGADAVLILKTFFTSNKPKGFNVVHCADKNDSGFIVGKLTTESAEYRVNITYAVKDGTFVVMSVRIE